MPGRFEAAARVSFLSLAFCWPLVGLAGNHLAAAEAAQPPAVGEQAPNFSLPALGGGRVELSQLTSQGPVVVVVLRGYPGYQCAACNLQVNQLLTGAKELTDARARVIVVYPGVGSGLDEHANEFVRDKKLPENFLLALDPDFHFTLAYGLRWEAKGETAYPATFVVGSDGTVRFAKISRTHKGRASLDEIVAALRK